MYITHSNPQLNQKPTISKIILNFSRITKYLYQIIRKIRLLEYFFNFFNEILNIKIGYRMAASVC